MLPLDLAANAESLGARVIRARTIDELRAALAEARGASADGRRLVIYIETDRYAGVPGYDGWWDVPVAEVSDAGDGARARADSTSANAAAQRQLPGVSPMS